MTNHVLGAYVGTRGRSESTSEAKLNRTTTAFALSAAITAIFNTLLAWIKDAYEPLNAFMKTLSGHHWTTHGIADVLLFIVLGIVLMNSGISERMSAKSATATLVASVAASGLGLLAWFILF